MPFSSSSFLTSSISAFASRISSMQVTIGIMILIWPNALARSNARNCGRYTSSLRSRQKRIARYPKNGFSSFCKPMYGISLSPPISRVRMITGLPFIAMATFLYASNCSSSVGIAVRSINKNSVRNRPTPSPSY